MSKKFEIVAGMLFLSILGFGPKYALAEEKAQSTFAADQTDVRRLLPEDVNGAKASPTPSPSPRPTSSPKSDSQAQSSTPSPTPTPLSTPISIPSTPPLPSPTATPTPAPTIVWNPPPPMCEFQGKGCVLLAIDLTPEDSLEREDAYGEDREFGVELGIVKKMRKMGCDVHSFRIRPLSKAEESVKDKLRWRSLQNARLGQEISSFIQAIDEGADHVALAVNAHGSSSSSTSPYGYWSDESGLFRVDRDALLYESFLSVQGEDGERKACSLHFYDASCSSGLSVKAMREYSEEGKGECESLAGIDENKAYASAFGENECSLHQAQELLMAAADAYSDGEAYGEVDFSGSSFREGLFDVYDETHYQDEGYLGCLESRM